MKKETSLRQMMFFRFLTAALVPALVYICAANMNMAWEKEVTLEKYMENNLESSDRRFTMFLENYDSILSVFCSDSDMLDAAEQVLKIESARYGSEMTEQEKKIVRECTQTIQKELKRICSRSDEVEGVAVTLENGKMIAYDRRTGSYDGEWMAQAGVPEVKQKTAIRGLTYPITYKGKMLYIFQIAKNIGEETAQSENTQNRLGVLTVNLNEEFVQQVIGDRTDSSSLIVDADGVIVSAHNKKGIGMTLRSVLDVSNLRSMTMKNEMSGLMLCNLQSEETFKMDTKIPSMILVGSVLLCIILVSWLIYLSTKPFLRAMEGLHSAMKQVEQQDFSVRVEQVPGTSTELLQMSRGFNEMMEYIEKLIEQVKQASLEQRNAELSALEAQIDPHFLYNTLDTINWKALENEQYEISEMLGALADILRYTVKNAGGMTTLRHELEWLHQYIFLQSAKIGRIPELKIQVPDELLETPMHKLLLQPFIENAMKYGFVENPEHCIIVISAKQVENQIHITIGDNGTGIGAAMLKALNDEKSDMGEHMGAANVRKRLKLYYGDEATVYFESLPGSYTRVHLFIPREEC